MFHIKAWISNWIPKNTSRKWTLLSLPRHHLEPERRTDSGRERGSCLSTSWQEISPPTSTYLSKSLIQSPFFFVCVCLWQWEMNPPIWPVTGKNHENSSHNQWNLIRTGEPRNFPCQLACNHRWYYPQLLRFFVLGLYPLMLLARWGFPHGNPVGIQRWSQQVSFHFHIGSSLQDFFYNLLDSPRIWTKNKWFGFNARLPSAKPSDEYVFSLSRRVIAFITVVHSLPLVRIGSLQVQIWWPWIDRPTPWKQTNISNANLKIFTRSDDPIPTHPQTAAMSKSHHIFFIFFIFLWSNSFWPPKNPPKTSMPLLPRRPGTAPASNDPRDLQSQRLPWTWSRGTPGENSHARAVVRREKGARKKHRPRCLC